VPAGVWWSQPPGAGEGSGELPAAGGNLGQQVLPVQQLLERHVKDSGLAAWGVPADEVPDKPQQEDEAWHVDMVLIWY